MRQLSRAKPAGALTSMSGSRPRCTRRRWTSRPLRRARGWASRARPEAVGLFGTGSAAATESGSPAARGSDGKAARKEAERRRRVDRELATVRTQEQKAKREHVSAVKATERAGKQAKNARGVPTKHGNEPKKPARACARPSDEKGTRPERTTAQLELSPQSRRSSSSERGCLGDELTVAGHDRRDPRRRPCRDARLRNTGERRGVAPGDQLCHPRPRGRHGNGGKQLGRGVEEAGADPAKSSRGARLSHPGARG